MTEPYYVTVTGHRHLWKYGADTEERLKQAFLQFAMVKYKEHERIVWNIGMAIGTDQACASIITVMNGKFDAYIPCANQECKWPQEVQRRYHALLLKARWVIPVSTEPYTNWCMFKRDEAMINACSECWAAFDGNQRGGTHHTIQYAQSKNKPVTIWSPVL